MILSAFMPNLLSLDVTKEEVGDFFYNLFTNPSEYHAKENEELNTLPIKYGTSRFKQVFEFQEKKGNPSITRNDKVFLLATDGKLILRIYWNKRWAISKIL